MLSLFFYIPALPNDQPGPASPNDNDDDSGFPAQATRTPVTFIPNLAR